MTVHRSVNDPIILCIRTSANPLFVEIAEDKGVRSDKAVSICVSTNGKSVAGSCGFDAHAAAIYFQMVSMGIECPGTLRKDGRIKGSVAIKESKSDGFYIAVRLGENTYADWITKKDIKEIQALFAHIGNGQ